MVRGLIKTQGALLHRQTLLYCTLLYCASKTALQIEGLWLPCFEQGYGCRFSNRVSSLRDSVSSSDNSCNVSNFFLIVLFVTVIHDL